MFSAKQAAGPIYNTKLKRTPMQSGFDIFLSFAYPSEAGPPRKETVSVRIHCTNGRLPEGLQVGDISKPTSTSPEFVEFKNITPPTANVLPPLGTNLLWQLLSHLSLNYLSLANAENLKELLELYIFEDTRDRTAIIANRKRVAGIENVETSGTERLVSGIMMRGRNIRLKARHDHFASIGDLYLFGSIMDNFLGSYASINTFTQLSIQDVLKGESYQWPARIGAHPLI